MQYAGAASALGSLSHYVEVSQFTSPSVNEYWEGRGNKYNTVVCKLNMLFNEFVSFALGIEYSTA